MISQDIKMALLHKLIANPEIDPYMHFKSKLSFQVVHFPSDARVSDDYTVC